MIVNDRDKDLYNELLSESPKPFYPSTMFDASLSDFIDIWFGSKLRKDKKSRIEQLVNCIFARFSSHENLFTVGLSTKHYEKNRYSVEGFAYRTMKPVLDRLAELNIIDLYVGFTDFDYPKKHIPSMIRMTDYGYQIMKEAGLTIDKLVSVPSELIHVHLPMYFSFEYSPPRKKAEYIDTERTNALRAEMKFLNETLKSFQLTLEGERVPCLDLYRVFHDEKCNEWGRLEGSFYKEMKKEDRSRLKIDDEDVVELDIKSCGLRVLANMAGNPLTDIEDAYSYGELSNFDRESIKKIILTLINQPEKETFPVGVKKQFEGIGFSDLKKLIFSYYPFIENNKVDVIRIESDLMVATAIKCLQEGIAFYPLYDSFLVKRGEKEAVETVFQDKSIGLTGYGLGLSEI